MSRKILIFLMAGILLGIAGGKWYTSSKGNPSENAIIKPDSISAAAENTGFNNQRNEEIPAKVYEVLKYIETFHEPKEGYIGGMVFHNYEKLLPNLRPNGNKIHYQEWDVNPKQKGASRGKERLITGDDKSAWYTDNHYKSFIKIK